MSYAETVYWFILSLTLYDVCAQLLYFCETNGKDPCEVANGKVPYEPVARYVNCDPQSTQYCDRYIVPGWYRYNERMWDQCPSLAKCGTTYPNWLNGTHPTEVNTEVQRTVCKVGFASCCERQVTIKIRNCGQFMAYCLPALDTCPERYCFGESGPCTSTTSQTTTNMFTTFTNTTTFATTTKTDANSSQSTTTTYMRTTKVAATAMATNSTSSARTKTTTELSQTVKATTNDESSSSTTVIAMATVIVILAIVSFISVGSFVFYRKWYNNKNSDGNTYDEPFTTLQENAYETSANVYTNDEEGYEQLPVDHNAKPGYPVQSEDPYDSIDDRIQSGLPRKEEFKLEEK